jgi:hypothetical protein
MGLDLVTYRIIEEVLASGRTAGCSEVDVRFGQHTVHLSFALNSRTGAWHGPTLTDDIVRAGGHVATEVTERGEVVSVELPLGLAARQP